MAPFIVRDVTDSDMPRFCEIEFLAYKDNELSSILSPEPSSPDALQKRSEELIGKKRDDKTSRFVQAIDEVTGKTAACAKWHIYQTSEDAAASYKPLSFGGGRSEEPCMAFYGGMADRKKLLIGDRPHMCMSNFHSPN